MASPLLISTILNQTFPITLSTENVFFGRDFYSFFYDVKIKLSMVIIPYASFLITLDYNSQK
jgi:hypothetical protein